METVGLVGITLRFDRELHDRLRRMAFQRRMKQSELVREVLRPYRDRLEQEQKGERP